MEFVDRSNNQNKKRRLQPPVPYRLRGRRRQRAGGKKAKNEVATDVGGFPKDQMPERDLFRRKAGETVREYWNEET
jgi:hypothetical protein